MFTVFNLFWTHIHQRSHTITGHGNRNAIFNLGDTEVKQFNITLVSQENIRRFYVVMYYFF